jgi:hypothetical protein
MMTQHVTVFHCQHCGRVMYQPRGVLTPACCGEPMVCAISDLVREKRDDADDRKSSTGRLPTARQNETVLM